MRTFDRYLLLQMLMLFGFFSLVLVGVVWVNRAISIFDTLIAGGSNLGLFLEITALSLPTVIVRVLPVAALVAAIYGLNRLSADSELVVARTAGFSPWNIARPLAFFGLLVAGVMMILTHILVPTSLTRLEERNAAISADITGRFLKPGEFQHPATGVTFYVREVAEDGTLLGIFLDDRRSEGLRTTYTAERALLVRQTGGGQTLVMFEGAAQTLRTDTRNLTIVTFADFSYDLAALSGQSEAGWRNPRTLLTPTLLRAAPDDLARDQTTRATYLHEAHSRFGSALMGGMLPLLAVACLMLGGFSRTGLWKQMLLATFLAIAMQVLSNAMEARALADAAAWPLIYVAPATGLALALGLLGFDARRRRVLPGTAGQAA